MRSCDELEFAICTFSFGKIYVVVSVWETDFIPQSTPNFTMFLILMVQYANFSVGSARDGWNPYP